MDSNPLFTLGLGLTPPWRVVDQRFETDKTSHQLHLLVAAESGARFPCPKCGQMASAHDWKDETWQHLDFFVKSQKPVAFMLAPALLWHE